MLCPKCAHKTRVIATVTGIENERYRRCFACKFTFATVEAIKFDDFWRVYAKETFNSTNKIKHSI